MIAIIDARQPSAVRDALRKRGFDIVALPAFPRLPAPVSGHPDMLIFIARGALFTHSEYYSIARSQIDKIVADLSLNLVMCDDDISPEYPHDVRFNLAFVGGHVIGLRAAVAHHILEFCDRQSIDFIDVRQGYSKCSVCIVSDDAIITADRGIARAARNVGIDVLEIVPGGVSLLGYDTGFLGGASGTDAENVYFSGNLASHPDAFAIESFCHRHGKSAVSLSTEPLFDGGTMFFPAPHKR